MMFKIDMTPKTNAWESYMLSSLYILIRIIILFQFMPKYKTHRCSRNA